MSKIVSSFAALGQAWNDTHAKEQQVKIPKPKANKPRKCPNCGSVMKQVAENVWICPFNKLADETLVEDGKEIKVQVFSECGNQIIGD